MVQWPDGDDNDLQRAVRCRIQNGRVSYVSDESLQVSGLPPERFLGQLAWELVHPHDRPLIMRFLAVGWTGEIDVALRLRDADSQWTWRRVRGVRTIDEVGRPSATITLKKILSPELK